MVSLRQATFPIKGKETIGCRWMWCLDTEACIPTVKHVSSRRTDTHSVAMSMVVVIPHSASPPPDDPLNRLRSCGAPAADHPPYIRSITGHSPSATSTSGDTTPSAPLISATLVLSTQPTTTTEAVP